MVTRTKRRKAPAHVWTIDEIQFLKTNHKFTRQSRREIADALGLTVGQVSAQIHRMGLVRLAGTRREWTEDEEQRLQNLAGTMPALGIARELRRSTGSVRAKMAAMGLSAKDRADWYTKTEVCEVLGLDQRSVQRHIDSGRLKATWYHGRRPGPRSGTAAWCIKRQHLREFLRRYPALLQYRTVDIIVVVDILAGVTFAGD